jgi:hypothetical protein
MQNLTQLSQTSAGNITAGKNFTVAGNLTVTGTTTTVAEETITTLAGITFTSTVDKGINFAGATPAYGDTDDAFIAIGTYNDAKIINNTSAFSFIPIQVNLSSTGNTSVAGQQVAAMRLRVDTDTGNSQNTAIAVAQLRSDLGASCYAFSGISQSANVSANITVEPGEFQVAFWQITGAGNIACTTGNVSVIEARMAGTGTGVDYVGLFSVNTAATIDSVIKANVGAGTVTNGINITGTMTRAINISTTTQAIYANVTAAPAAGSLTSSALCVYAAGQAGKNDVGIVAYLDATAKGISTGNWTYGAGIWLNIDSTFAHAVDPAGWANHEQLAPLSVGVYAPTAVSTGIDDNDIIYGIKAELVGDAAAPTSHGCYFAALNVSQVAATRTAIFFAHQGAAVGQTTAKTVAAGALALVDINGVMYYVNLYSS